MECLERMDIDSFKLAFDRFESRRGKCFYLVNNAGSNFMGARNLEERLEAEQFLNEARDGMKNKGGSNIVWDVNPPNGSHFGSIWERSIRSVRSIIDSVLIDLHSRLLDREEFDTLLCEAELIVNSTPLWEHSSNPGEPQPLCPSDLLLLRGPSPSLGNEDSGNEDRKEYGPKR